MKVSSRKRSSILKQQRGTLLLPSTPDLSYFILQYISSKGYPISPSEIAGKFNLNPASVRSRMSRMVKKGLLSRPSYGLYELTCRDDLQESRGGLRAQNLVVVAEGIPVKPCTRKLRRGEASEEFQRDFNLLSLRITFGAFRGKITYRVGVPLGLCPVGLELVHYLVVREVEVRGYKVPEEAWIVENIEFLEDFRGFRVEGLQGVTFWNVLGEMEKYYNRPGIRREVRLSSTRGVGLNVIQGLIRDGVDVSLFHDRVDRLEREMENLIAAQKGSNRIAFENKLVNQALLDHFIRYRDREGSRV